MKKLVIVLIVSFLLPVAIQADRKVNIIPQPTEIKIHPTGEFIIRNGLFINYNSVFAEEIAFQTQQLLKTNYNIRSEIRQVDKPQEGISFILSDDLKEEQYLLEVTNEGITIKGKAAGLFYGLQSLMQMLPLDNPTLSIPALTINDTPRFEYRGVMLDVARYFYPVDYIKRFIDLASHYKINKFHWHLTEDGGWRIEIKKYPQITYNGAFRRGTQVGRGMTESDRLPVGGYYTQEEIKELVEYAAKRNITVIPEIDMPGHMMALLASFPEISCRGERIIPTEHWNIQKEVLCPGNPQTYRIIEDILDEIVELFPSEIIHIGGDEAPKDRWKECPKCQQKISTEKLKDEFELQSYFINHVSQYMASKGRKVLGWDEILEGGLPPGAMVMSWRGEEGGIAAAQMGHEVVMAPTTHMYHDYYQGDPRNEPLNIFEHHITPLRKVYDYEPRSPRIPGEFHKYVIGIQANLWCEFIHSTEKLEYMTYPRLLAAAEVGWSSANKDWEDFRRRLKSSLTILDRKHVNYRIPEPMGLTGGVFNQEEITIQLEEPLYGATIFYSLDNSDPLQTGHIYTEPIKVKLTADTPTILNCVVKSRTGRVSLIYSATYNYGE